MDEKSMMDSELMFFGDGKYIFPADFATEEGMKYLTFQGKPDDIWISTYQRSGITNMYFDDVIFFEY